MVPMVFVVDLGQQQQESTMMSTMVYPLDDGIASGQRKTTHMQRGGAATTDPGVQP
jgi:hypothetical protein